MRGLTQKLMKNARVIQKLTRKLLDLLSCKRVCKTLTFFRIFDCTNLPNLPVCRYLITQIFQIYLCRRVGILLHRYSKFICASIFDYTDIPNLYMRRCMITQIFQIYLCVDINYKEIPNLTVCRYLITKKFQI